MAKNVVLTNVQLAKLINTILLSKAEQKGLSYPNFLGMLTEAVTECTGSGYLHLVLASETPAGHEFQIQVRDVEEGSPFYDYLECELTRHVGEGDKTEIPLDLAVKARTE